MKQEEREKEKEKEVEANRIRQQSILKTRSKTNELQEKNAIKVVSNNDRLLGKASIGDTVFFFQAILI